MLTKEQLLELMPRCPKDRVELYAKCLEPAMFEVGIVTVVRASAFLAQLAHESGELRFFEEIASGQLYEGRADLGNDQPGDGRRYKGRGPIQLTGRKNYRAAGSALALHLELNPELAATPEVGFRVAAWYWTIHKINDLADKLDFRGVTRAINGGYNGLEQRAVYYHQALEIIGRDAIAIHQPSPDGGQPLKG